MAFQTFSDFRLQPFDCRAEAAERVAVEHRNRCLQSEVADFDDAKARSVRAVLELAPGHQAEAGAARNHGKLKVFPEYLGSHPHGDLGAITRALQGGPAAASGG